MTRTGVHVRVVDAALAEVAGPVHLVLSGLDEPERIATALMRSGPDAGCLSAATSSGRLEVRASVSGLLAAAREVVDARRLAVIEAAVVAAVRAHGGSRPAVVTPHGLLTAAGRPTVMGVLNVTPDSFFDGGVSYDPCGDPAAAVRTGEDLLAAGADLVDVGGESTRPGAEPVDTDEELSRVLPVIEALSHRGARVSIDTRKAEVARRAVAAGAVLVNDVSAGRADPRMWSTVAELGVGYVLMHMQGTPRTMQDAPTYDDVVAEVFETLAGDLDGLSEAGVPAERVLIDPGIGFGKTVDHNLALLAGLRQFTSLGRPVLVGVSRKRFVGTVSGTEDPAERLEGSLAIAALAVAAHAAVVRVHDVPETLRVVRTAEAVRRGQTVPPAA